MKRSEKTKALDVAISKAQGEFPIIGLDANNPYYRSKYAPYDSIVKGIRPVCAKYGLVTDYSAEVDYGEVESEIRSSRTGETTVTDITSIAMVAVTVRVTHAESGEWKEDTLRLPCEKVNAHGVQSVITYAKRNALILLLDIAVGDEDDDGNEGVKNQGNYSRPQSRPAKKVQPEQKVNNLKKDDLEPKPDDLPFDNEPYNDPKNNPVTHAKNNVVPIPKKKEVVESGSRQKTSRERVTLGLITKEQYDKLIAAIQKQKIEPKDWMKWLNEAYGFVKASEIKATKFNEIYDVVSKNPEIITNFEPVGGE